MDIINSDFLFHVLIFLHLSVSLHVLWDEERVKEGLILAHTCAEMAMELQLALISMFRSRSQLSQLMISHVSYQFIV